MTAPTLTDNPVLGPEQIYVEATDAGNVLLTFVSSNHRLREMRELPPDSARRLITEVSRVLRRLAADQGLSP